MAPAAAPTTASATRSSSRTPTATASTPVRSTSCSPALAASSRSSVVQVASLELRVGAGQLRHDQRSPSLLLAAPSVASDHSESRWRLRARRRVQCRHAELPECAARSRLRRGPSGEPDRALHLRACERECHCLLPRWYAPATDDHRQVANQIALRDAIEKYGGKKVFTFHRDVKSAQSFASAGPEGVGTHLNSGGGFQPAGSSGVPAASSETAGRGRPA